MIFLFISGKESVATYEILMTHDHLAKNQHILSVFSYKGNILCKNFNWNHIKHSIVMNFIYTIKGEVNCDVGKGRFITKCQKFL